LWFGRACVVSVSNFASQIMKLYPFGVRIIDGYGFLYFSMNILQGVVKQLSEQILTLNERMDEFTCRMEELNSKMSNSIIRGSASYQNLPLQNESCNGSGPTNQFVSHLGNGTLLPHSSSSNQLHKESPLMEEVSVNPIFFSFSFFNFQSSTEIYQGIFFL
jgi:hypothetical protein